MMNVEVESKHILEPRFDLFNMDCFILMKKIEIGGFSKVYLAGFDDEEVLFIQPDIDKSWLSELFAIKIIDKSKYVGKTISVYNEYSVLSKLNHPNIVKIYAQYEDEEHVQLVLEYIKGYDLFTILTCHCICFRFSQNETIAHIRVVLNCLKYLHDNGIIHGDIKLENILLSNNNVIKLVDFGHSVDTDWKKFRTGTDSYMSPEVIQDIKSDPIKAEVWCIGVLMYEMLSGKVPFKGKNEDELYLKIIDLDYSFAPTVISTKFQNLIESILKYNPEDRPTIEEILCHELFK